MSHTRRKAEEFAHAAEGGAYHDPGVTPLLDLVEDLVEVGHSVPGPSAAFRESVRHHLLAVGAELDAGLDAEAAASRTPPRRRTQPATAFPPPAWRRRLALAGFAVGVVAGGAAGTAMASNDALPGDALYGVKRTVEEVQLALAGSDEAKGQRYLDIASTRLDEVSRLVERPDANADPETVDQIADAFTDLRTSTQQGRELLVAAYQETGDSAQLGTLLHFVETQRSEVESLQADVPAELQREPEAMISLLEQISTEVFNLDPNAATADEPDTSTDTNALPYRAPTGPTDAGGPPTVAGSDGAPTPGSIAGGVTLGGSTASAGTGGLGVGVSAGPSSSPGVDVSAPPGLPLPNVGVTLLGITVNLNLSGS